MSHHDANILDRHAYIESAVHRLDPRAKVIATLFFILTVVSYRKYAVAPLVPFIAFPMVMAILGFVPVKPFMKRLLVASPFVVLIGIFNPLLDKTPLLEIGGMEISGGWVSFTSIVLRGLLCVSAAIVLVATTGFARVVEAMNALSVPKVLVVQLMLLYRYLFVLIGEAGRMNHAKSLRSASSRTSLSTASSMLSVLLVRTIDRADAIWLAMQVRGFDGELKTAHRMKWRRADTLFLGIVIISCVLLRLFPVARMLGRWGMWS